MSFCATVAVSHQPNILFFPVRDSAHLREISDSLPTKKASLSEERRLDVKGSS